MTTVGITIEIDPDQIGGYANSYLALAWHVAQANPAPYGDKAAGELVEGIGREIIRRWLGGVAPELWHHQGRHHPQRWLSTFARYVPGGPAGKGALNNPEWNAGEWVARTNDGTESTEQSGGAS